MKNSTVYKFKKLNHLYKVIEIYTCGIQLQGWENGALDAGTGDINVGFCTFNGKNFCLVNSKITPLLHQAVDLINEKRERILLLNKSELNRIRKALEIDGKTCVPMTLYRNERNLWKINIAVVTGLKVHDRREKLKLKDLKREQERE